jgi:hypothetical protein
MPASLVMNAFSAATESTLDERSVAMGQPHYWQLPQDMGIALTKSFSIASSLTRDETIIGSQMRILTYPIRKRRNPTQASFVVSCIAAKNNYATWKKSYTQLIRQSSSAWLRAVWTELSCDDLEGVIPVGT